MLARVACSLTPLHVEVGEADQCRAVAATLRVEDGLPFNVCSLYLHVGLGLAQENLGLLAATGLALADSPHAFIIGADWQVGPEVIQQADWTRKAAATSAAPKEPSLRAAFGRFKTID